MAPFWHDPAINVAPLPDVAPALGMARATLDAAQEGVLRAHLTRGQNRLVWALEQAGEVVSR
jgi:N-acetylated-alpha-linked acidic dipeptidase